MAVKCTVAKLHWQMCSKDCGGDRVKLGSLEASQRTVMLSRLSPFKLDFNELVEVTVCRSHIVWLGSSAHPCTKRTMCGVLMCSNPAKRELTRHDQTEVVYSVTGSHVPIGGRLCESHRKQLLGVCYTLITLTISI